MTNLIGRIADLVNELKVIKEQESSLAITIDYVSEGVQIGKPSNFFEHFTDYDITTRIGDYPYRASVEVDGIEFFTLLTAIEYNKYVQINAS
ncbi:hypothetical protein [Rummeliibacillus pycnus]|uniref:hypothetical protein n=1 Tax=Rummeliibacillus pycnus TaxID=101070 RepID=UPI0037C9AE96